MDAYNGDNQLKQQDTTQQQEGDEASSASRACDWSDATVVKIEINEGLDEHKKYKWSINVHPDTSSSDCNAAGDILNPISIPEYVVCDPKNPEYCKLADLSANTVR
ncbi:hypothetical protein E3P99_00646 [Wallemia hederae]|uniref:Uncharacterized protein n=1 Tax=Wallemia hederae TaxID=1540922 RepID=A0A4T0FX61_9BASI|nr:hypothetical protein E3P99_00646 [Wallemia hederae]